MLYAFRYLFIYIADIRPSPRSSPIHSLYSLIIFLDFKFEYSAALPSTFVAILECFTNLSSLFLLWHSFMTHSDPFSQL